MSIKTGSMPYEFPENSIINILAEVRATIFSVDEEGELSGIVASTSKGRLRVRTKKAFNGFVKVPEETHWSMEVEPIKVYDKVDPIPFEPPEEMKSELTLEDRLKSFINEMVQERYGRNSDQYETVDEFMDFDDDDDIQTPISGYEVLDMQEVAPEETATPYEQSSTGNEETTITPVDNGTAEAAGISTPTSNVEGNTT